MKINIGIRKSVLTLGAVLGLIHGSAGAAMPTAEQIALFKQLPQAQQERLSRQMGIDMSILSSDGKGAATPLPLRVESPVRTTTGGDIQSEPVGKPSGGTINLKPFGYDVLAGEALGFVPVDNLPIPNDYVMAPGDEVNVQVYGKSNKSYSLVIDREGNINFPEFGPVSVTGQSFAQMRQHIISLIREKVIGVDVAVTMGSMRTMPIYVVGEVAQPGAYSVNGLTSVTQALIASGGVKTTGSLRNIQLKRGGRLVSRLDMYDLLVNGDSSGDVRLLSGDTLFIPTKMSSVSVSGEVLRPGIYELKGRTSISRLLRIAGGANPSAYLSRVSVQRMSAEGSDLFTLDLSRGSDRHFILENGDRVELLASTTSPRDVITLRGELVRQGVLNYKAGMRISDVLTSVEE